MARRRAGADASARSGGGRASARAALLFSLPAARGRLPRLRSAARLGRPAAPGLALPFAAALSALYAWRRKARTAASSMRGGKTPRDATRREQAQRSGARRACRVLGLYSGALQRASLDFLEVCRSPRVAAPPTVPRVRLRVTRGPGIRLQATDLHWQGWPACIPPSLDNFVLGGLVVIIHTTTASGRLAGGVMRVAHGRQQRHALVQTHAEAAAHVVQRQPARHQALQHAHPGGVQVGALGRVAAHRPGEA